MGEPMKDKFWTHGAKASHGFVRFGETITCDLLLYGEVIPFSCSPPLWSSEGQVVDFIPGNSTTC